MSFSCPSRQRLTLNLTDIEDKSLASPISILLAENSFRSFIQKFLLGSASKLGKSRLGVGCMFRPTGKDIIREDDNIG